MADIKYAGMAPTAVGYYVEFLLNKDKKELFVLNIHDENMEEYEKELIEIKKIKTKIVFRKGTFGNRSRYEPGVEITLVNGTKFWGVPNQKEDWETILWWLKHKK